MLVALLLLTIGCPLAAAEWHGYVKHEFTVDGIHGYVVAPRRVAPGNPWLWRARFPDYHPDHAIALLSKGFHIAYYDQPNVFGSPHAVAQWDRFYAHVTRTFGLAPKANLEGVSRGGLFVYQWARRNPSKVASIYCESPVCDLKSWPGGRGSGAGSPKDWQQALAAYQFTESEMLAYRGNPIDFAAELAAHKIPILHIVQESDRIVPPTENTTLFAARYRAAGGPITVHWNTALPTSLEGHHFPLDDPAMIVNFVLRHTPATQHLAGTGLTPHGVEYFKLREGLRNSLARFQSGPEARVAFLGGSITNMTGWRDQVCSYLQKRFPKTRIHCLNAGIPSTGSTPGAFRLHRDVLSHGPIDLLFEEAAVNDESNGFSATEQLRGMEGIVRHARRANPLLDTVLLYFVDPAKMDAYRAGRTPEVIATHDRVATHYGIPSIDLAREVTERVDAGEFTWDTDFRNLHPSPFGQTVYTRSIIRLLEAAWREPATAATRPHPLPPPLDPGSYDQGRLADPHAATCDPRWTLDPAWKPADGIATRPGFVNVPMLIGTSATGECRIEFNGTATGVFAASGPDAGKVEFSIDNGPWQSRDFQTRWSPQLHLPWAVLFGAGLPNGSHDIRFRVTSGTLRIAHFLVNGPQ